MRLSDLLGATVAAADGTVLGRVTDVRLAGPPPPVRELRVEALLVSPRHTGSLFGYDRRREQGPWLVRAAVRRLHRGAFLLGWEHVVDWDVTGRRVTVTADPAARREAGPAHEAPPAR